MTQYDYIVIGAGSAGCVVANRLTEDPETTVLLIEAGNPATKPEIQVPVSWIGLLGTEVDWAYFHRTRTVSPWTQNISAARKSCRWQQFDQCHGLHSRKSAGFRSLASIRQSRLEL